MTLFSRASSRSCSTAASAGTTSPHLPTPTSCGAPTAFGCSSRKPRQTANGVAVGLHHRRPPSIASSYPPADGTADDFLQRSNMRPRLDLTPLNSLFPPITIGTALDTTPSPSPLFNAHVFALHLLFPLPFSSPPRRQANDDAHGYFPPEDFQDLRPVRQVLMRK